MSLTSLLLAFLAPVAARFKPVDETPRESPVDDKSHPRFITGYDAGLADGRCELAQMQREIARARAEAYIWREIASAHTRQPEQRAMVNPLTQVPGGRYLQAMQQQMLAHAQNQQAFAYNQGLFSAQNLLRVQGLFGAQNLLGVQAYADISCTPSRSRALTGRGA